MDSHWCRVAGDCVGRDRAEAMGCITTVGRFTINPRGFVRAEALMLPNPVPISRELIEDSTMNAKVSVMFATYKNVRPAVLHDKVCSVHER
jgi:hypothetical protein